ncbi:MAG: biotin-dependent carboxyltransferase family protein [Chloroflexi bacterium]|nr:biotin-dependent carboxyltransferase family protein [Chloroflexota bacterium]
MVLEVLEGGLLTTVQDLGRHGYEGYGVPVAGAMDAFALQAANALVGNDLGEAGLELTVIGPRLRATEGCLLGLAGADLGCVLDGQPLAPWRSYWLPAGATLSFGGPRSGCRTYLAVAGGVDLPLVLGSRSTYLRGGFGGYKGRALRAGDVLALSAPAGRRLASPSAARFLALTYGDEPVVRVLLGPQADRFTAAGMATFLDSTYEVSGDSDRMGSRLKGPRIEHTRGPDVISDGIALGSVQVPGDGQPIVMLADRQTTGGYTKIATVIDADIQLLAQCLPGASRVRFQAVDLDEAVRLRGAQAAQLTLLAGPRAYNLYDVAPADGECLPGGQE